MPRLLAALAPGPKRDTVRTMSRENVEIVRSLHDAFNRRDLDAYLALHHPDVQFLPYEASMEGGDPYCGHDGVRAWWRESLDVLPNLEWELHEVREIGDRVFTGGRLRGKGAGSGASFERALWQAAAFREGKLVWWAAYETRAEALEAAGP